MKVLAMDIGAGTVDILLYDDEKKSLENCIKLVLPSPSEVFAEKVREATCLSKDLCVKGDIIGGGAFAHALKEHIEVGFRVFMTEYSAYSVRNDLAEVEELGIKLVKDGLEGFKGETLMVREINIEELKGFLAVFGEDLSDVDYVAIAVQDHGVFPKGVSNRRSRIEKLNQLLVRNPKPEAFAFMEDEIPQHFLRMKSAAQASRRQLPSGRVLLMDTSPDAILGCLMDPIVEKMDPILAVNLGNGHTMSAIISSGEILAVMEHHTRLLNPQKIEKLLINFANGEISDEEVFNENGHGLFFLSEPPGYNNIKKVVVTGPNRNILARTNLPVHFAAPAGDVMMTGPIGLVEAVKRKLERNSRA